MWGAEQRNTIETNKLSPWCALQQMILHLRHDGESNLISFAVKFFCYIRVTQPLLVNPRLTHASRFSRY